jgi:hypothetical protein
VSRLLPFRLGRRLPARLGLLLRVVVLLSTGLLLVGLLLGGKVDAIARLDELLRPGAAAGDRLVEGGFLLVVLAPIVALVLVGHELARRNDRRLVALVALELILLALGLGIGAR